MLWLVSPAVARWISVPRSTAPTQPLSAADARALRLVARRTWALLRDIRRSRRPRVAARQLPRKRRARWWRIARRPRTSGCICCPRWPRAISAGSVRSTPSSVSGHARDDECPRAFPRPLLQLVRHEHCYLSSRSTSRRSTAGNLAGISSPSPRLRGDDRRPPPIGRRRGESGRCRPLAVVDRPTMPARGGHPRALWRGDRRRHVRHRPGAPPTRGSGSVDHLLAACEGMRWPARFAAVDRRDVLRLESHSSASCRTIVEVAAERSRAFIVPRWLETLDGVERTDPAEICARPPWTSRYSRCSWRTCDAPPPGSAFPGSCRRQRVVFGPTNVAKKRQSAARPSGGARVRRRDRWWAQCSAARDPCAPPPVYTSSMHQEGQRAGQAPGRKTAPPQRREPDPRRPFDGRSRGDLRRRPASLYARGHPFSSLRCVTRGQASAQWRHLISHGLVRLDRDRQARSAGAKTGLPHPRYAALRDAAAREGPIR